jgi:hypothetical protein
MKMFKPPLNPDYPKIPFLVAVTIGSNDINDHYAEHQSAARALAEQYCEEKKVCADLLAQGEIA